MLTTNYLLKNLLWHLSILIQQFKIKKMIFATDILFNHKYFESNIL